jgi:hypothetical protein
MNCWEFKKCGRQQFGEKAKEFGVCPAAIEKRTDGVNGGKNGGRCCWALAGTLCGGKVQGSFVSKAGNCMRYDFFRLVSQEEGRGIKKPTEILALIQA